MSVRVKFILLSLMCVITFFMVSFCGVWNVRTPELFGDGRAYLFQTGNRVFGLIHAWGIWAISGKVDGGQADCRISQLAGERIQDANGKTACFMEFKKGNRFNGWIDFRGHTRAFCGAVNLNEIPAKCKYLSE